MSDIGLLASMRRLSSAVASVPVSTARWGYRTPNGSYRPERLGYVAAIESFDRIRTRVGPRGPRSPFGDDANDWLVAVEETKITPADRPTIVPVGHTFIR